MNEPTCNDNMITLSPNYIASTLINTTKKRKTENRKYYSLRYYIGFQKNCKSGYFTEEELEKHKKDIEKIKNKFTDTFTININELTPNIIKHFRYVEPYIEYPSQEVLIDPYILGAWLGDGHSNIPTLTNVDIPVIDSWCNYGEKEGLNIRKDIAKETRTGKIENNQTSYVATYHMIGNLGKGGKGGKGSNKLLTKLQHYDLLYNKHIPDEYLLNDENVRLQVLAGLIDTDGSLVRGSYEITQKNKLLSENIVSLCKSLGFHTTMKERESFCMYKGEKRTGTYYRMMINLNQFSKEVPVLIERKKWKYTGQTNICSPSIDINGNIICRSTTNIKWDEDMKIKLYSIVDKIKQSQPDQTVDWNIVKEQDDRFKNASLRALDTMYFKTLIPEKEKYDELKIDITIDDYALINSEWKKNYEEVKNILDNNISLSPTKDKKLYTWLYRITEMDRGIYDTDLQKKLWNKLLYRQNELVEKTDLLDWKQKLEELREYIKENNKSPVEKKSTLGNWLKVVKKGGGIDINPIKKQLWEELLTEYKDIIFNSNNSKKVKVLYPNKTEKIFDTRNSAIREIGLGLTRSILIKCLENGTDFKSYYFCNI
jgi:hypothetical protein